MDGAGQGFSNPPSEDGLHEDEDRFSAIDTSVSFEEFS